MRRPFHYDRSVMSERQRDTRERNHQRNRVERREPLARDRSRDRATHTGDRNAEHGNLTQRHQQQLDHIGAAHTKALPMPTACRPNRSRFKVISILTS